MDTGLMGDIDSELQSMDFGEDFPNTQLGMAQGMEDALPKATGYLISTSPPGKLPEEFWGHDKPQTSCSLFKVPYLRTKFSVFFWGGGGDKIAIFAGCAGLSLSGSHMHYIKCALCVITC